MSAVRSAPVDRLPPDGDAHELLVAAIEALRPDLHRYASRITGSVFDGEDVVQDTIARAHLAIGTLRDDASLRSWLFRIVHNRSLDLVRSRSLRATEPLDAAADVIDDGAADPEEAMILQETVSIAVSRFAELGVAQRCVVVLKDVLGFSLAEICSLLDRTLAAVKADLHRARNRLREINTRLGAEPATCAPSLLVATWVDLFNRRDWDALRSMLVEDVRLDQSYRVSLAGSAQVGLFFTNYGKVEDWFLVPAMLEGREVIAVLESADAPTPSYFMVVEGHDAEVAYVRDYRYARYVAEGASLTLWNRN